MGDSISELPELQAIRDPRQLVRIPPEIDVPVTPRVLRLLDTSVMRRLCHVSQLGLVSLVYPGATHSRFEHSIGVYRNALLFLQRLGSLDDFRRACSPRQAELLIVASLLHDIGHWPFCHAIEDIKLPGCMAHEVFARQLLKDAELQELLERDWQMSAVEVAEVLAPQQPSSPRYPLLGSILSGPIDIDKLDYLDRDSLHAGVPYGRNFDRHRLISQLCLGSDGCSLAITDKGRTAAEMMVFARYIMFSEVYWHHAVRSATCMLQQAVWALREEGLERWRGCREAEFIELLRELAAGRPAADLLEGLFGSRRVLHKRLAEYHRLDHPELHAALARRPFPELARLSAELNERVGRRLGMDLPPYALLIDAPPVKLEVQLNIRLRQKDGSFFRLSELSPVAEALADRQFDDLVKRVRIFVCPTYRSQVEGIDLAGELQRMLALDA
jgi:HD superfamily phosphohydrolase